ncbi:unnamed protein product, partial [Closterium sp. NIES-65]
VGGGAAAAGEGEAVLGSEASAFLASLHALSGRPEDCHNSSAAPHLFPSQFALLPPLPTYRPSLSTFPPSSTPTCLSLAETTDIRLPPLSAGQRFCHAYRVVLLIDSREKGAAQLTEFLTRVEKLPAQHLTPHPFPPHPFPPHPFPPHPFPPHPFPPHPIPPHPIPPHPFPPHPFPPHPFPPHPFPPHPFPPHPFLPSRPSYPHALSTLTPFLPSRPSYPHALPTLKPYSLALTIPALLAHTLALLSLIHNPPNPTPTCCHHHQVASLPKRHPFHSWRLPAAITIGSQHCLWEMPFSPLLTFPAPECYHQVAALPVGDALWWVAERKRVDDLWQSIKSKRFKDQKLRIKPSHAHKYTFPLLPLAPLWPFSLSPSQHCGLRRPIYVVEGNLDASNGAESLRTAYVVSFSISSVQTLVHDGFDVHHTTCIAHTRRHYAHLTRAITDICNHLSTAPHHTSSTQMPHSPALHAPSSSPTPRDCCVTFDQFLDDCRSSQALSVGDVFGHMLLQVGFKCAGLTVYTRPQHSCTTTLHSRLSAPTPSLLSRVIFPLIPSGVGPHSGYASAILRHRTHPHLSTPTPSLFHVLPSSASHQVRGLTVDMATAILRRYPSLPVLHAAYTFLVRPPFPSFACIAIPYLT